MKDSEFAYVAGLFDIAGCVRIETPKKGANCSLFAWVVSPDFKLMEYLQLFGARIGQKSDGQYRAKWRDNRAHTLLFSLLPYLRMRKEEALVGIDFMTSRKKDPNNTTNDATFRLRLKLIKAK